MDESLTDEERAALKADAIRSLRDQEAELERRHAGHMYKERGQVMIAAPSERESYNDALLKLQRAGEDIPDWMIRPPHTIKWRPMKAAPLEDWIDGSAVLADIKRMLAQVDPQPE